MAGSELYGTVEDRIVAYLRASIAARGGQARRTSRIQMEMEGPWVEDGEFAAALQRLVEAGRIRFEEIEAFGFVYVHLVEPPPSPEVSTPAPEHKRT